MNSILLNIEYVVHIIAPIIFIVGTTLVDLLAIMLIKDTIKDMREFELSELFLVECILILIYTCLSILLTAFVVRVIYLSIYMSFIE